MNIRKTERSCQICVMQKFIKNIFNLPTSTLKGAGGSADLKITKSCPLSLNKKIRG